jgi:NAD(P)-dependent dehydrogenase (short-subunit alcohol dehydrogenase family)
MARTRFSARTISLFDDLSDRAALERHLVVNLFGTYAVTQAFLPLLVRSQGTIVNNVSLMALAALPLTPPTQSPRRPRSP